MAPMAAVVKLPPSVTVPFVAEMLPTLIQFVLPRLSVPLLALITPLLLPTKFRLPLLKLIVVSLIT